MSRDVGVVIPAAGAGRRMGGARKPFLEVDGRPLLSWTLEPFLRHSRIGWIALALSEEEYASPPMWLRVLAERAPPDITFARGGAERGDSVRAGIAALPAAAATLLVHDAARPLVSAELIDRVIAGCADGSGAVAALPLSDTVKEVDAEGRVLGTPDRARLWRVQTPQGFPAAMLRDAYERAAREGVNATDDAALVERFGGRVRVVDGAPENIKVTAPADLLVAETLLRARGW